MICHSEVSLVADFDHAAYAAEHHRCAGLAPVFSGLPSGPLRLDVRICGLARGSHARAVLGRLPFRGQHWNLSVGY